jgi:hypothetical protein
MATSMEQTLIEQLNNRKSSIDMDAIAQKFIDKAVTEQAVLNDEKSELQALIVKLQNVTDNDMATEIIARYNERITYRDAKVSAYANIASLTPATFEAQAPTYDADFYADYVVDKDKAVAEITEIDELLSTLV